METLPATSDIFTFETFRNNTPEAAEQLKKLLLDKKEWSASVVMDADANVLCSTVDLDDTTLTNFTDAYADRDKTISTGFHFQGKRFEVHRWHPPLIFGRNGMPRESEGIALLKGTSKLGSTVFIVITYRLPILACKAAPELIDFFKQHIGDVAPFEAPSVTLHPQW